MEVQVGGEISLNSILRAAKELNAVVCNHSKIPVIDTDNTDMKLLENLLQIDINECDFSAMTSNDMAEFLHYGIHQYGRVARKRREEPVTYIEGHVRNKTALEEIERNEIDKWRFLMECNDSKKIWQSISMKGEIKPEAEDDVSVEQLADCCSSKSRIDISQTLFKDIKTDVVNEELDKDIEEAEVKEALEKLNKISNTGEGITPSCV